MQQGTLFAEPDSLTSRQERQAGAVEGVLHFDGSCIPNPGLSRCGYVLRTGNRLLQRSIDLGEGTCNTAEYGGIIHGMEAALAAGVTDLEVYGDSKIVIHGMTRASPHKKTPLYLESLRLEARQLAKRFRRVEFNWVPREENEEAHALSIM